MKKLIFYCLGAAHVDVKAKMLIHPSPGESIPVSTTSCFGGVARNIADNLSKEGCTVVLCSIVGSDQDGQSLINSHVKRGIDCQDILLSLNSVTAKYYAIISKGGELFVATADMGIYDELSPELINPCLLNRLDIADWIVDSNLSRDTIKAIAKNATPRQRLWGIGVSSFKANRLADGFPHWHGLFLNRKELKTLTGIQDVDDGIRFLQKNDCKIVVVTAGTDGVYYSDSDEICYQPSLQVDVVDVTGAGDAFCAGAIYALSQNRSFDEAIAQGFHMANKALLSLNSSLVEAIT